MIKVILGITILQTEQSEGMIVPLPKIPDISGIRSNRLIGWHDLNQTREYFKEFELDSIVESVLKSVWNITVTYKKNNQQRKVKIENNELTF